MPDSLAPNEAVVKSIDTGARHGNAIWKRRTPTSFSLIAAIVAALRDPADREFMAPADHFAA
jgi:hypothetical protein